MVPIGIADVEILGIISVEHERLIVEDTRRKVTVASCVDGLDNVVGGSWVEFADFRVREIRRMGVTARIKRTSRSVGATQTVVERVYPTTAPFTEVVINRGLPISNCHKTVSAAPRPARAVAGVARSCGLTNTDRGHE